MKTYCKYVITEMQIQNGSLYLLFLYPIEKSLISVNMVLVISLILLFKFTGVHCIGNFYSLFEKHRRKESLTVAL